MKHAMVLLALAGCVEHKAGLTGTQSLGVELVAPVDPGDMAHRLPDTLRTVTVNVTAYDAAFAVDSTFDRAVQVYAQFLGTLTPTPTLDSLTGKVGTPLATLHLSAGKVMNQTITLPAVVGPTNLWIEDGPEADADGNIDPSYHPTYATGASPTLWFRDPVIADIQTPISETALDALTASPLANKQISVNSSRYGDVGRLVVTSVFAQGYTVSDVKCSDASGAPPCSAAAYDHIEVFSFSAPADQNGKLLKQGQVIDGFSGGISEFDGLTEIGFPVTFASNDAVTPDREPTPVKFDPAWFGPLSDPNGRINFERNEAAPIEIDNAKVCMLDDDFTTFGQWKLDPSGVGGDCSNNSNVLNVITAGVIASLDPATLVDKVIPRVVGVVRPVEIGTFNVWIIYPRSAADVTLQ